MSTTNHITAQDFFIKRSDREYLLKQTSKVIWFTGLSGAGKSTLANALEVKLSKSNKLTYILDADNIRLGLNQDLGLSDKDRSENIRRISEVAKLFLDTGTIVIVASISPFKKDREAAKNLIGRENFIEIHVNTPLSICQQRDPKGLYKKSNLGEIINLTGINSIYEAPETPALRINTSIQTIDNSIDAIINLL